MMNMKKEKWEKKEQSTTTATEDLEKFNQILQKSGKALQADKKEVTFKKDNNGKIWDGFGRTIAWWSGKKMSWDDHAEMAKKKGGKLLSNLEAQALLKWAGGPIMKEDAWVPTYRVQDKGQEVVKDWIQIGVHACGVGCSHIDFYGYPVWGDKEGWETHLQAFNMKK